MHIHSMGFFALGALLLAGAVPAAEALSGRDVMRFETTCKARPTGPMVDFATH
jgi:hypothetical protein